MQSRGSLLVQLLCRWFRAGFDALEIFGCTKEHWEFLFKLVHWKSPHVTLELRLPRLI